MTSAIYAHKRQVSTTMRPTYLNGAVINFYEYGAWGVPLETTQATVVLPRNQATD